jgi:predicted phage tail protein
MTTIIIHGYLSKKFGSHIKIHLGKINDALSAIDSIKNGFRQEIINLQNKGFNYCIKKQGNVLNIIPLIVGAGRIWAKVFSVVLIVVGVVLIFFGIPLGFSLVMSGLQLGLAAFFPPKIKYPDLGNASTGGASFALQSNGKSYIFSNASNLSSQGSLVNFGYGKMLTGSKIINISLKNYSTNVTFEKENYFMSTEAENSTFSESNDLNLQNPNIT